MSLLIFSGVARLLVNLQFLGFFLMGVSPLTWGFMMVDHSSDLVARFLGKHWVVCLIGLLGGMFTNS
jgi:hypothetical protein